MTMQKNNIGDNGGDKCPSEIRCQWLSKIYLVREHDDWYTPNMSLSSLGLKVIHTVQYVVGLGPTDKVLQKNREDGLACHKSRLHWVSI
jgi:hypothetical protein